MVNGGSITKHFFFIPNYLRTIFLEINCDKKVHRICLFISVPKISGLVICSVDYDNYDLLKTPNTELVQSL